MMNPLKITLAKGAFEKQDKVFPNYRENDMKNKSETDFSMRRNKDKKQKANIKNHSIYVPFLKKSLTLARE